MHKEDLGLSRVQQFFNNLLHVLLLIYQTIIRPIATDRCGVDVTDGTGLIA